MQRTDPDGCRPEPPLVTLAVGSAVPPYEQIRLQLAGAISRHELAAGTRLPTVRQLAHDLGLAVNTVARAYRELETAGLVRTGGRAGTVVTSAGDDNLARLQVQAGQFAALARELGVAPEQALQLIRTALDPAAGG